MKLLAERRLSLLTPNEKKNLSFALIVVKE